MSRLYIVVIVLLFWVQTCPALETSPTRPVIKPYLHSFTQMRTDLRRDTILFKQEKVIFGVNITLNKYWSARVGVDLIGMNKPYLKPTVLTYQKERWKVDAGIFFTSQMDLALSKFWDNRFIERVPADRFVRDPTADLGLRVTYQWSDFIATDLSLVSGNGYQHLGAATHPKPAFRVILSPGELVCFGGYASMQKVDITETTVNGFFHLQMENKFKMTGEYHYKSNFHFVRKQQQNVASLYSTYSFLPWLGVVGQYDIVWSDNMDSFNTAWNIFNDGKALIVGLIFRCFPTVRLSVDYLNWRPSARHIQKEDWLYVCLEFKY